MKILVPIDFSPPSKTAARYAAKMAASVNAELTLFNSVYFDAQSQAQAAMKARAIQDIMMENAESDAATFAEELRNAHPGLTLHTHIIKGHPLADMIEKYTEEHPMDLIVMGTKGASGVKKVLMGSNAAAVIGRSKVPVLSVPEDAEFTGFNSMVYATDTQHVEDELDELINLIGPIKSVIHIVHVLSPHTSYTINTAQILENIRQRFADHTVTLQVIKHDDVLEGIEQFVAEKKADVLAMFTHQLTFFERLFGRSITRQMAFHASTPMLSLKKRKK